MPQVHFSVQYYHFIPGKSGKWAGIYSGTVPSQSETLVMQLLRKRHPGHEIELREIRWN